MASSKRYRTIAPSPIGSSAPLTTDLACRMTPLPPRPVAHLLACPAPSTSMDLSHKSRRRIAAKPALGFSRDRAPQGDVRSATGRLAKDAASWRVSQGYAEDDFLGWTPFVAGPSASSTTSDVNSSKSRNTGPPPYGYVNSPAKNSAECSPKSSSSTSSCSTSTYSTLTIFSSADDSDPFDAQGESERLIKIHDLAEEIVAREAAVRECQQDAELARNSEAPSGMVRTSKTSAEILTSLATSSLMPLAMAAGTSARASLIAQPSGIQVEKSPSSCQVPAKTSSSRLASCSTSTETVADQKTATSTATTSSPAASSQSGTSRRKRMQGVPAKSPQADDPKFRGAVVRMQLKMVAGKPQLQMEHYFNNIRRRRTQLHDYAESSDLDDDDVVVKKEDSEIQGLVCPGKQCASCSTRLTPLWRDAEDGTPLCNACGIRYKKYKVRCSRCWHIPGKNENTRQRCNECGEALRFVLRKSSMP